MNLRKRSGMTQEKLAARLGVSFQSVSKWENAQGYPDIELMPVIAAVFFARNGYQVSAFDIAESGIEKGKRLAELSGVSVNFFRADLLDYRLENEFDIIYASGTLQYIPQKERMKILCHYKEHTAPGGIHIMNVFVEKPYLPMPPDWEEDREFFWKTGELFYCYSNWKMERMEEYVFDCGSSGVWHRHCMDVMIARREESRADNH